MRSWLTLALGILVVAVGVIWTLQGLGYLGGSVMTGERIWAIVGPVVALAGVVVAVVGLRSRRRTAPPER